MVVVDCYIAVSLPQGSCGCGNGLCHCIRGYTFNNILIIENCEKVCAVCSILIPLIYAAIVSTGKTLHLPECMNMPLQLFKKPLLLCLYQSALGQLWQIVLYFPLDDTQKNIISATLFLISLLYTHVVWATIQKSVKWDLTTHSPPLAISSPSDVTFPPTVPNRTWHDCSSVSAYTPTSTTSPHPRVRCIQSAFKWTGWIWQDNANTLALRSSWRLSVGSILWYQNRLDNVVGYNRLGRFIRWTHLPSLVWYPCLANHFTVIVVVFGWPRHIQTLVTL